LLVAIYNVLMFAKHRTFAASGASMLMLIEGTGVIATFSGVCKLLSGGYGDALGADDYLYLGGGLAVAFFLFLGHTIKKFSSVFDPKPAGWEPKTGNAED
jgi:hypothetical protein